MMHRQSSNGTPKGFRKGIYSIESDHRTEFAACFYITLNTGGNPSAGFG